MSVFASILCSAFLILCESDISKSKESPEEFVSSVKTIEPELIKEEKMINPHKQSALISQESWLRAMQLRPIFMNVAEEEFNDPSLWLGVLVSLSHQESRHRVDVCSPAAACGNMQFIMKTAKAMAATDCRDLGKADRSNPEWAIRCGARLLKQNMRIVKVHNTLCDKLTINAIDPYNEGVGWTKRAQEKAKDPGDINSVTAVSIKHPRHEIETDRYHVYIMGIWYDEYLKSNYMQGTNPCANYKFSPSRQSLL